MNRVTSIARLTFPLLVAFATAPVCAADPPMPAWERLTPAQREMLVAPLRERWNAHPEARGRMLEHAQRWRSMTPQERANAGRGFDRLQNMSPAEREQARAAFQRFKQLSPDERRAIRQKLKTMPPDQRKAWLRSQGVPAH